MIYTQFSNKNLVIKEKISGSGRTELSTFVVRVTHFTDLESENCTSQLFEYISTSYYNLCVSSI